MVKNQTTVSPREEWMDIVKFIAIFLVILGHFITSFDSNYLNSNTYIAIYGFHMPLFMMVAGFFIKPASLNQTYSFIKKRASHILFPALLWGMIIICLKELIRLQHYGFLRELWWGLWFFKSLFCCIVILAFSFLISRNLKAAFIIAFIISQLSLLFPHLWFLQLNRMLPCLIAGMLLRNYEKKIFSRPIFTALIATILFVGLLIGYDSSILYPPLDQLLSNKGLHVYWSCLYSLAVGLSGATSLILICYIFFNRPKNNAMISHIAWGG